MTKINVLSPVQRDQAFHARIGLHFLRPRLDSRGSSGLGDDVVSRQDWHEDFPSCSYAFVRRLREGSAQAEKCCRGPQDRDNSQFEECQARPSGGRCALLFLTEYFQLAFSSTSVGMVPFKDPVGTSKRRGLFF